MRAALDEPIARHVKKFSPIGQHLSHIRLFVGVKLPPLLVVRAWEGTMGNNLWRDYLKDPHEFDGWLRANAFVGSIVALVILSMALAALYSGGGLNEIELSSANRLSSWSH
jgi:hypothetical protein